MPLSDAQKRLNKARRLVAKGASQREAARVSHVGHGRLSRDVGARPHFESWRRHPDTERMDKAVRELEQGASLRKAAKRAHISRERVAGHVYELGLAQRPQHGKRLSIAKGAYVRMSVYTEGGYGPQEIVASLSREDAAKNWLYMRTVGKALRGDKNAQQTLDMWAADGEGVQDSQTGDFYTWVTDFDELDTMTDHGDRKVKYSLA